MMMMIDDRRSILKKLLVGFCLSTAAVGFGGMSPAAVARPGQQRGGRRGGLGYKRGGFGGVGAAKSSGAPADGETNGAAAPARSNADFKAMFEKSREQAEPKKAEE